MTKERQQLLWQAALAAMQGLLASGAYTEYHGDEIVESSWAIARCLVDHAEEAAATAAADSYE